MNEAEIGILYMAKGAGASILLALALHRAPMGVQELALCTGHSDTRVATALKVLEGAGLVVKQSRYNGWAFTAEMRRLLLGGMLLAPNITGDSEKTGDTAAAGTADVGDRTGGDVPGGGAPSGDPSPAGETEAGGEGHAARPISPHYIAIPPGFQEMLAASSRWSDRSQNLASPSHTCPGSQELASRNARRAAPLESLEDLSLKDSRKDSSSDSSENGEIPLAASPLPAVERILDATGDLFGESVLGPPSRFPDAHLLLAAIAECYDRRSRLRNPARVVFAKMVKNDPPAKKYLDDPLAFLPAEFLLQVGLHPHAGSPASPPASPYAGWDLGDEGPHYTGYGELDAENWDGGAQGSPPGDTPYSPPPSPTLDLPVGRGPHPTATEAWQVCTGLLRHQMPRFAFDSYVASARLASYDPEGHVLYIAAANPGARDWLEDRLTQNVQRMLVGICSCALLVRYINRDEVAS